MKNVAQPWTLALCLGAAVLAGAAAAHAADRPNLTPGKWEMTITTDMPGMPSRSPMTTTHCIKPEDVKDSHAFADAMQKRKGNCTPADFKFDGGKLSYSWSCEDGSGSAEFVFAGTSYEGTTKVSVPAHGKREAMTMTQHVKAKRVGDC